jgi:hypothetical protein
VQGFRAGRGREGVVGWAGPKGRVDWARWWASEGGIFKEKELGCHGYRAELILGCAEKKKKVFRFWFKEMGSKSKVLNISKPNLNWIQNRIKSNQLFGTFSNLEILEIDLNNEI